MYFFFDVFLEFGAIEIVELGAPVLPTMAQEESVGGADGDIIVLLLVDAVVLGFTLACFGEAATGDTVRFDIVLNGAGKAVCVVVCPCVVL